MGAILGRFPMHFAFVGGGAYQEWQQNEFDERNHADANPQADLASKVRNERRELKAFTSLAPMWTSRIPVVLYKLRSP